MAPISQGGGDDQKENGHCANFTADFLSRIGALPFILSRHFVSSLSG
jgi:hypothetical protein